MASHCHNCDQFIDQVSERCREVGARLTPIREQVLRLIVDQGRPIKAYDLLDLLKQSNAGAAPPTVYRALDFLLENGFVHKLESINAFVSCGHIDDPHQGQFLICDRCEVAVELDDDRLSGLIFKAASSQGFAPLRQTVEVHGYCRQCANADTG